MTAILARSARALAFASVSAVLWACADHPATMPTAPVRDVLQTTGAEGRYIILFRDDATDVAGLARSLAADHRATVGHVYQFAVRGFAIANLSASAVGALRRNPVVRSIEQVKMGVLTGVQQLPLTHANYRQSDLWGLDRIDERMDSFDGFYRYSFCGAGTHIYILDSGIRGGHAEWGYGRIGLSVTKLTLSWGASPTIDQNGHGTGVAGVAAGATYGVAKCATLHSVRIQDGGGSIYSDDMVAGIDWVTGHHEKPAVLNASFGFEDEGSFAVRNALEAANSAGVITIKSAGNDSRDAYQDRSNRARGLILVAASERSDSKRSSSNYGTLVSFFAPGTSIYTAGKDSNTDTRFWNGTSFAAPFAAGVAALILEQEPTATPWRVKDVIVRAATEGELVGDLGSGSGNRILFSRVLTGDYPPPPIYPTAPTIMGPDLVQPYSNCMFSVAPGSAPDPHTYAWYLDGVLQAETSAFFRAAAGTATFQVELHLVDGNGYSHWDYHYATVSNSAPQCLDS